MKEDARNILKTRLETCHNIVLTGAPGTGKTYTARQIAAQLVLGKENVNIDNLTPDEETIIKERTAFVQFHPSYDYTDFVEGLRPVQNASDDSVIFRRFDGAFKNFCKLVLLKEVIKQEYQLVYDEVKTGKLKEIPVGRGDNKATFANEKGGWGLTTGYDRKRGNAGEIPRLIHFDIMVDHGLFTEKDFEIFKKEMRSKGSEKPLRDIGITQNDSDTSYIMMFLYKRICGKIKTFNSFKTPYVFIIDEINRGELSKIFGELFFSIDPEYRGNKKMRVQTQYQNLITDDTDPFKDGFYVPNNVYIIGTMNDIDRSIESMDFAIRRRFAWVEVKANDNTEMLFNLKTVERSKAEKVMFALNNAIWDDDAKKGIEGLSRAYHIGASYFLKLDNFKESDNPFVDLWDLHLEGLLREYLRGLDEAKEKLNTLQKAYNEAAGING